MMKTVKHLLCCAIAASALISTGVHAASWKDALSSAASELGNQNSTTQEGGWSLASLTNLLSSGNQALSADNMNNAAGILQYCAKQKLASVTDAENIKNQVLEKLGLNSEEQKEDTNYLDGIQGLLKTKDGQQLNLDNIGTTPLAEKVKTKAWRSGVKAGAELHFLNRETPRFSCYPADAALSCPFPCSWTVFPLLHGKRPRSKKSVYKLIPNNIAFF